MTTPANIDSFYIDIKTGAIIQHQRRTRPVCDRYLDTGILIIDNSRAVGCPDCKRSDRRNLASKFTGNL